jgi:hypothetical protein
MPKMVDMLRSGIGWLIFFSKKITAIPAESRPLISDES